MPPRLGGLGGNGAPTHSCFCFSAESVLLRVDSPSPTASGTVTPSPVRSATRSYLPLLLLLLLLSCAVLHRTFVTHPSFFSSSSLSITLPTSPNLSSFIHPLSRRTSFHDDSACHLPYSLSAALTRTPLRLVGPYSTLPIPARLGTLRQPSPLLGTVHYYTTEHTTQHHTGTVATPTHSKVIRGSESR